MGLFKKKPDPISERARTLNDQIVALESEIKKLSVKEAQASAPSASPASRQPRLRSTALPHGQTTLNSPASAPPAPATPEPIFEEMDQQRLKNQAEVATPEHYNELGVRKYDLAAFWRRIKNNFRGPATSNPKLVNYLAAGSIQGLRPLRYEKRVARNRFLALVIILVLVLWGVIAIFIKHS